MKAIKLVLSDQIHQIALDLAKAEDVEIGQFSAGVLSDALTALSLEKAANLSNSHTQITSTPELPDTVTQAHEVCRGVWKDGKQLSQAIQSAAYKFKVLESTVRDKCTRRINLGSISEFTKLLSNPHGLVEHLCSKLPRYATSIRAIFAPILPDTGSGSAVPATPPPPQPPHDVTEMDLIAAIVEVLKAHGGKLDKADAEREVFAKFEATFKHPHYQEEVGGMKAQGQTVGGIERWRKNVQFARHTACNTLCLIKTPYEAGRGVWELTDKGRAWVRS
jgi:hypothetical protein